MQLTESDIQRFWKKVNKSGPVVRPELGPCWLWGSAISDNGYGFFELGYKTYRAHRVSYFLAFGNIPSGLIACHKCDVRLCVNPDHLWLGKNFDNAMDRQAKGRTVCGRDVLNKQGLPCTTLTPEKIKEIRFRRFHGEKGSDLAKEFGVHPTAICKIHKRHSWRHVN